MAAGDDVDPVPEPPAFIGRTNQATRRSEKWRPPIFSAPQKVSGLMAALRRFLDLQAGSIWNDLAQVLPDVTGSLLDVGCGAQPYRPLLSSTVRYVGIDTADAKDHFGYEVPDTLYFSGKSFPVADEQFDAVLCTETLEHVLESQQFIAELSRCLKVGGLLVMTVPMAARVHYIPHDYWRFTPFSLSALLESAGFSAPLVYARGNAVTVACYKLMALIIPMLFAQGRGPAAALVLRLIGLLLAVPLFVLALIGNISLKFDGGDDCLGYTVLARKRRSAGLVAGGAQ